MRRDQFRTLFNIVASTLAEVEEAPEGIIYAGIMHAEATLDDFYAIKELLLRNGLAVNELGHVLRATPKLTTAYRLALSRSSGHLKKQENGPTGGDDHDASLP